MKKRHNKLISYLKLIRVKQYVKNLLIVLPLFFSGSLLNNNLWPKVLIGLVAFSFTASLVYIINDYKDIKKDRKHPKKKNRPLASGALAKREAIMCGIALSIVIAIMVATLPLYADLVLLVYLVINIAYSFWLKNIPLVDVAIVASGFYLRLLFGAFVVGVDLSVYITLTVLFGALFMAFGKRRNELLRNGIGARGVLKHYNKDFLDKNMYVMVALSLVFYALWVINVYPTQLLIASVPVITFLLIRYSYVIESDTSDGDPSEVLLSDTVIQILALLLGVILVIGVYIA